MATNVNGSLAFKATLSTDEFNKSVESLKKQLTEIASTEKTTSSQAQKSTKELTRELTSLGGTTKGLKEQLVGIGSVIGISFGVAGVVSFIKSIVSTRAEIQALQSSFDVLVGDADKSKELFSSIKDFAANTPMELAPLAKGAQTLLSFNIESEKVMPILKQIGDISMANADKFSRLILAYSQMSSTGKLMGQDLLQMINAGFNPLGYIAEKTGKTILQLKKEMGEGAISVEMVQEAFADAASEGGKFYGMLEKQSKTLAGAMSNLSSATEKMMNEIGEKSQGAVYDTVSVLRKLVDNYEKVGKIIVTIISTYGTYKAGLMVLMVLERLRQVQVGVEIATTKQLTLAQAALVVVQKQLKTATQALASALSKGNIYVMLATAVVTLIGTYWALRDSTDAEKEAQDALNNSMYEYEKNVAKRTDAIKKNIETINDETVAQWEQIAAFNQLKELYPGLLKNMDFMKIKSIGLEGATKLFSKEISSIKLDELSSEIKSGQKRMKELDDLLTSLKDKQPAMTKVMAGSISNPASLLLLGKIVSDIQDNHSILSEFVSDGLGSGASNLGLWYDGIERVTSALNAQKGVVEALVAQLTGYSKAQTQAEENRTVIQNKEYWENIKKDAEQARANMPDTKKGSEEWEKQTKIIADAEKHLEAWNKTAKVTGENIRELNKQLSELAKEMIKFNINQNQTILDDIFELEFSNNPGDYNMQLQQIERKFEAMLRDIEDLKEDYIDKLNKTAEIKWKIENPYWQVQGKEFNPTATEADFTAEINDIIKRRADFAYQYRLNSETKLYTDLKAIYLSFEEQKEKIRKDFDEKIKTIDGANISQYEKNITVKLVTDDLDKQLAEVDNKIMEVLKNSD
ncbi:MAG: tape measure protein, partial [Bacteroidales bacterium]|nr:tape measure protein [Bacteroidales bacterium]